MNTIGTVRDLLAEAGYAIGALKTSLGEVTTFENEIVIGFVLHYPTAAKMISSWHEDSTVVLSSAQFALRRAPIKAWNVYFVFLSDEPGDYGDNIAAGAIEEDLRGTRKIVRAGVQLKDELRAALLPLTPVQNAPRLEAVDMAAEIRLRTTELPEEVIEAFISRVSESTLLQLLEAAP